MTSPTPSFRDLGIEAPVLSVLDQLKFTIPTPIQQQAIPLAIQGQDVIGIAQTGTGKTLAFGIPMIQRLCRSPGIGLILAPTRELAQQIDEAIIPLATAHHLRTAVLIGGASMRNQLHRLRENPRIVVATPGRLNDIIEQGRFRLKDVCILVLDEADRMLDMGFLPQIRRILQNTPPERQTMVFSATMPSGIVSLASNHMRLPARTEIAPAGTASELVTQELFIVRKENKARLLGQLLRQHDEGPVLVFVRTRRNAGRLTQALRADGHSVAEIHADRSLAQRTSALNAFKAGNVRVLVATDIAARGIDVKGIALVVNHDLPDDPENYVHRIGRAGRAGHTGHAVSLACPDQGQDIRRIEKILQSNIPVSAHPAIPAERFQGGDAPKKSGGGGGGGKRPSRGGPPGRRMGFRHR